jgi:hypothetical protein
MRCAPSRWNWAGPTGYVARGAITLTPAFGPDTHPLPTPYKGEIVRFESIAIGMDQLVVIAATSCGLAAAPTVGGLGPTPVVSNCKNHRLQIASNCPDRLCFTRRSPVRRR